MSAAALTTSLGASAPAVTPPPLFVSDIIFQEDGALTCNWSDNYAKDAAETSNHLVVWALPDVSTANWSQATPTLVLSGETKTTLIRGNAYGWCNPAIPKGTVCSIDTLVGSTWLSIEVESLSKTFATSDLGLTHFAALLNPIVTAAQASSFVTEPKWTDPAATTTPTTCTTTLPYSEVATASGATGINAIGPDLTDQESLAEYLGAAASVGRVECDLGSGDEKDAFFATVLPGGAWAWSQDQTAAVSQPGYATVPSLGTKAFEYKDTNANGVEIDWVRGDNLCSISVTLSNPAKDASVALALATYVNNEIPG